MKAPSLVLLLLTILLLVVPARADEFTNCGSRWERDVYVRVRPAVVRIRHEGGLGAGFFFHSKTRIATAMHVMGDEQTATILLSDGTERTAHLVSGDRERDVALLDLDGPPASDVVPLEPGSPVAPGDPVVAIGHPWAFATTPARYSGLLAWSISRGIVGARNGWFIQTDTSLDHGSSGGPLLDCTGAVVGVVSHGPTSTLNFASTVESLELLEEAPRRPSRLGPAARFAARLGATARFSEWNVYGFMLETDLLIGKRSPLLFAARLSLLSGSSSSSSSSSSSGATSRLVTGHGAGLGYLGVGPSWRLGVESFLWATVGVSAMYYTEHAIGADSGQLVDKSTNGHATRFTPGLALWSGAFALDYRMEIDMGRVADSAHLVSMSWALW